MVIPVIFISIMIIGIGATIPLKSTSQNSTNWIVISNKLFAVIVPSILLSLIFGLRNNVGVDYPVYKDIFENISTNGLRNALIQSPVEWLFTLICYILKFFKLPYYYMFILMAFIPMTFYMLFIRQFPRQAFVVTYFLFACGIVFWYFNILRQGIAFFILLYSTKYIIHRELPKYIFWVFIASGFHLSSFIFILFYFCFAKKIIIPPIYTLVIYITTWIISDLVLSALFSQFDGILLVGTQYEKYANNISTWKMQGGSGLGILSLHLVDIGIILLSKTIYIKFYKYRLDIFYSIFYIGALLSNIANNNMLLSRIPFCMVSMRFLIAGCLVWYIYHNWRHIGYYSRLCGISIFIFSTTYLLGNILYTNYSFIGL